jgi:predicted TIM-barrel fold metal-dependent hydrolase
VKLSAGYRVTRAAAWSDLDPFARALIDANPDGIVWGSDWPHPGDHAPGTPAETIVPFQKVDNGHALRCLARWCENDAGLMDRILVTTPARLYRFNQAPANSARA